jgi:hypothetical protein
MPAALPPTVITAPAPVAAGVVTQAEADQVLLAISATLKKTRFLKAWPSAVPGLIALQMEDGKVAYCDKSARYFILGVVLDTATGAGLDHQLDAKATND